MFNSKCTILLADDDKDYSEILATMLENENFDVYVVHDGVRAIEFANKVKPNVILLDLNMPAGRGKSVIKSLRSYHDTRHIPIIVVSGDSGLQIRGEMISYGAKEFIPKPVDGALLLRTINKIINIKGD